MVATTAHERAELAVPVVVDPTHHLSRIAAGVHRSPAGAAVLQALKKALPARPVVEGRQGRRLCSWRETPDLHRKLICRAAGLPLDVADKLDRDLSEREKAMLRAAVLDLRVSLDGLGAL